MATKAPQAPAQQTRWYALAPKDVEAKLGTDGQSGLTVAKAAELLASNGPNALPAEKPVPEWLRFLRQYKDYMQIILLIAGIVSLAIGEFGTGLLLLILTLLNAVVGLREEGKAQSAMNALKSMMKATARVRRDGNSVSIPAEQLVLGDVVVLNSGDQVPADGRLLQASALQIDESALTGESTPAGKMVDVLPDKQMNAGDQTNMAFMNTPVTHGSGVMVVTGTGANTAVGKIAGLLSAGPAEKTPLQRQLNKMTLWIGLAALITMGIMFALGMVRGDNWKALFVTAVALAIAAIPEALPTVVQVILSMGAVDLAKRNAIVKDLSSVETLGSTSAINSDKTGTLTMNQMTAVEVVDSSDRYKVSGVGYSLEGKVVHTVGAAKSLDDVILPFIMANDSDLKDDKVVGDPTEGAFLVLAHKAGVGIETTRDSYPRIATLPFDPTYKLMATFHKATDDSGKDVVRCFVKGAAPAVGALTTTTLSDGESIPFDDDHRKRGDAEVARLEGEGLRVMAGAQRDIDPAQFDPKSNLLDYIKDLEITALIGMIDPPRDSSKKAVADAQGAHIRVRMITGDDIITGAAIAKQLGIPGEAILGADFAALSEADRLTRIDDIGVVGRVAPEHKALIASTLKAKGEIVAMTGDGVNDAPAIKEADIGIAMGTGTEVAKSASRMILSDDNFATIVFAIEQGRKLYDNLTKYVRFILVTLVAFVIMFLGASLLNIAAGQPFTPLQILWLNFLVDMPLGIALGFDKESPGIMKLRPRKRDASILTKDILIGAGLAGLFMAVCMLAMISYGIDNLNSAKVGVSMALTAFVYFRIVSVYESRSKIASCLTYETFNNRRLNQIVLGEIVLAFLVTAWNVMNGVLGTIPLSGWQWTWSIVPAVVLFILWELGKALARALSKDSVPASAPSAPAPSAPAPSPVATK